jgi:hypothetical protein
MDGSTGENTEVMTESSICAVLCKLYTNYVCSFVYVP